MITLTANVEAPHSVITVTTNVEAPHSVITLTTNVEAPHSVITLSNSVQVCSVCMSCQDETKIDHITQTKFPSTVFDACHFMHVTMTVGSACGVGGGVGEDHYCLGRQKRGNSRKKIEVSVGLEKQEEKSGRGRT